MFKFFFVAALIVCVVADGDDHHAETKLWKTEIGHEGWHSEFETTNHIRQAAHGDKHGNIVGDFEWVDPHGEHVAIKYVADEYGYQPEGDAIPKGILRALELIKSNPHRDDDHHNHHNNDHHNHHDDDHHHHHHHDDDHHHHH